MDLARRREALSVAAFAGLLRLMGTFTVLVDAAMASNAVRGTLLKKIDRMLYGVLVERDSFGRGRKVQEDKYLMVRNFLHLVDRALRNKNISPRVRKGLLKVMVGNIFLKARYASRKLERKEDFSPPAFLTVAPGEACNLRCRHCYAGHSSKPTHQLDFDLLDRIIDDKTRTWGSYFTVVTGGEPFLWKSNGKDILDLAEKHRDNYFLIYTNGTLIDDARAERMAALGNVSPAISVEGFEAETDARRGEGVYKRILEGMRILREVGVPFGVSVTATRDNASLLLSDEFIDFYFNKQGIIFVWLFQYMPIGYRFSLDPLITPEQRRDMYLRVREIIEERKLFVADFWNLGSMSDGCLCAGRPGGYFYIDWNGNIMPCVFIPYAAHNIKEIYASGGTISTALDSPFFKALRGWQREYGFLGPPHEVSNELAPCPIRDHHRDLFRFVKSHAARPVNREAAEALSDMDFVEGLCRYGKSCRELTEPIWEEMYLAPERERFARNR